MSEIAKCPVCGEYPGISHADSRKGFSGIMCCGVTIWSKGNPSQWNQYAAAMELANAEATIRKIYRMPLLLIEGRLNKAANALDKAKERVIEVFK